MKIYNHDIANLIKRLRRFKVEIVKSVSSGISEMGEHDLLRLNSYLDCAKSFKKWMVEEPILDLPETSPMEIVLEEMPVLSEIENDDLSLVHTMMNLIESELLNSQSARRSTGLISHDAIRFDTYITKIENFIDGFIVPVSPLDLPESSPSTPMSGPGNLGA